MANENGYLSLAVSGTVADIGRLSMLETELALRTIVIVVVLGVFLGVIGTICWLLISTGLIFLLAEQTGMSLGWGATLITGLNILLLVGGALLMRRLQWRLPLPATRTALKSLAPSALLTDQPQQEKP